MRIYHIDYAYNDNNDKIYYVFPYSFEGVLQVYLSKTWLIDNSYKEKRYIKGLFDFLKLASFSAKRLEKRCKKMNKE